MVKAWFVAVAVALGVVVVPASPAQAETCASHIAKRGTTAAADIEYHRVNGGVSPCEDGGKDSYDRDYRTSRWEDRASFDCGWSWRGGFGC